MIEEFVGKTVEIIVAFSMGGNGGSGPIIYTGKLLASDTDTCRMAVESATPYMTAGQTATAGAMKGIFGNMVNYNFDVKGNLLIRKQFIVSILEKF